MKQLFKYLILGCVGGSIYFVIEMIYKGGSSHWTMAILGGLCFICIGLINEVLSWETPLWKQALIGGITTTVLEFITGYIVNILLGWNVWNYSNLPLNILGQISLPFTLAWCLLSVVGIILDDYLRYWLGEENPRYKLF